MKRLRLDQVSSIVIPFTALPVDVKDIFPGNYRGPFAIELVR